MITFILTILLVFSVLLNVGFVWYFKKKFKIIESLQEPIKNLQEAIRTNKPEELIGKLVDFSILLKEITKQSK